MFGYFVILQNTQSNTEQHFISCKELLGLVVSKKKKNEKVIIKNWKLLITSVVP